MTLDHARRAAAPGIGVTARAIAVVGLGLAVVACGSGPTVAPSVAPSIAPPPTAAATLPPTAPPATQAGPTEPCSTPPGSAPGCEMLAGDYHAAQVDGGISFTLVGGPWTNVAYLPEILSLQMETEWVVFMAATINIPRRDTVKAASDPEAAQDLLVRLPGIAVTPVDEPIAIDGRDAVAFDVVNTGDQTRTLWWLGNTSGRYELEPGASVRMHWLEVDGQPFVLALESATDSFEAMLTDSVPIVESIAFDD